MFFLCVHTGISRFSDIELQEGDGIPTEEFLQSCYAIVPVLGKWLLTFTTVSVCSSYAMNPFGLLPNKRNG